jgi:hypothetical protein
MFRAAGSLRALLIGIDAYPTRPLLGCINDIDAIPTLLTSRLGVPSAAIRRLVAPSRSSASISPDHSAGEPTLDAIREALEALAGDQIAEGDRVLIYYSGHGARVRARHQGHRVSREAIVPVDALSGPTPRFLFDSELNAALRRIRRRTPDVTVILDCCHSAGVTRSDHTAPGASARWIHVAEEIALPADFPDPSPGRDGSLRGLLQPQADEHLVVAACQANETALELKMEGGSGIRHGALTAALLEALSRVPDARLPTLRWCDLWMALLNRVAATSPTQHPWLMGRPERRVFGGPWERRDAGYGITFEAGRYRVHAGSLAGVNAGAELAVYGDTPALFPPLDSEEDRQARIATLLVIDASQAECTAIPSGEPFALPDGARARLVRPGRFDRLLVEIRPMDASLAGALGKDDRIEVAAPGSGRIEAVVSADSDAFRLGDDIYGDTSPGGLPPLLLIPAGQRAELLEALLRYARYRIPLRMAERSRDLPGALSISILSCDPAELSRIDLQNPDLPEVRSDDRFRYAVRDAEPFCIRVTNSSRVQLYATLVHCAAGGKVEILGDAALPPGLSHVFWHNDVLGAPFTFGNRLDHPFCVERIIALATSKPGVDLRHLAVSEPLRGSGHRVARGERAATRDLGGRDDDFLLDQWTAQVIPLKVESRISRAGRGSALRDGSADPSLMGRGRGGARRG